jgi:predicted ATPase
MADFLLALIASERQVLIETHSEHLINRIRLRVAERSIKASTVSVYFVALDPDAGSSFTKLTMTDAGSVTTWPQGFLDRASIDAQRLLHANLLKGLKL